VSQQRNASRLTKHAPPEDWLTCVVVCPHSQKYKYLYFSVITF
jgi:hypothetical protein